MPTRRNQPFLDAALLLIAVVVLSSVRISGPALDEKPEGAVSLAGLQAATQENATPPRLGDTKLALDVPAEPEPAKRMCPLEPERKRERVETVRERTTRAGEQARVLPALHVRSAEAPGHAGLHRISISIDGEELDEAAVLELKLDTAELKQVGTCIAEAARHGLDEMLRAGTDTIELPERALAEATRCVS